MAWHDCQWFKFCNLKWRKWSAQSYHLSPVTGMFLGLIYLTVWCVIVLSSSACHQPYLTIKYKVQRSIQFLCGRICHIYCICCISFVIFVGMPANSCAYPLCRRLIASQVRAISHIDKVAKTKIQLFDYFSR